MSEFKQLIRECASCHQIKTTDWIVSEVDEVLLIRELPDRENAASLAGYLVDRGLFSDMAMGNKAGTLWAVMAPPTKQVRVAAD